MRENKVTSEMIPTIKELMKFVEKLYLDDNCQFINEEVKIKISKETEKLKVKSAITRSIISHKTYFVT